MPWEYSDKVLELFQSAVSGEGGTHMGEIKDPDGCGEHGSIVCGDALKFTFKVDKHPTDPKLDKIIQAKYLTFGCTSAIAASEALCAVLEATGKTPIDALSITNQDLVDFLGGLPEQKIHCSVMGAEALHEAIADWAKKRDVDLSPYVSESEFDEIDEGRVVCKCFSITDPYLRRKIPELGLKTIEEVKNALKAGGACTGCHHGPGGLQDLLDEIWGLEHHEPEPVDETQPEMSAFQLGRKVETVVDALIRPRLKADGGDIALIDIKGYNIYCRLEGACASCSGAQQTLKLGVEGTLKDEVDERIRVIQVGGPS